jgi:GT2 family glycosyltransferase/glycosyltransferase involved in cell wall biosynthesis
VTGRRLRVVIASVDVAGPYHCGGVGAAYHGLALALADAGHDVTVLYTHHQARGGAERWRSYFASRKVEFVHAPQPDPGRCWFGRRKEASLDCYQQLKRLGRFDVVHFHEWLGLPYYSLIAKRQGLAFEGSVLCVGTHGPMRWSREGDQRLSSRQDDLIVDYMERASVELADVLVSPSAYLLRWMCQEGWSLPQHSYVAPNLLSRAVGPSGAGRAEPTPATPAEGRGAAPAELVFFGRLDRRKGLPFFCDVLDRLAARGLRELRLTFLGSLSDLDGATSEQYIRSRSTRWPFAWRVRSDLDREAALEYLRGAGRLAVMPSALDNSACTVQECLQEGVPFLTTDVGGTAELIAPECRASVLVPRRVEAWAERLHEIVARGQLPPVAAAAPAVLDSPWVDWHRALPRVPARTRVRADRPAEPLVSVCLAHFERPGLLRQMVDSLRGQTWPRLEIIVADDGSRSAPACAFLQELEAELAPRRGAVLRLQHGGPAAARRAAAERARGDLLLFLDDDDWAEPHAVETLARVATRTGADALVCVYREFSGNAPPGHATRPVRWNVPLGPALAAGLIYPELGGAMIAVRPEVFRALGGFPEGWDVDEDWEFLLELVARGYRLEVVPESLFWYRRQPDSRSQADNRFQRTQSRLRRFERILPPGLRDLAGPAYAQLARAADAGALRRLDRMHRLLERAALGAEPPA